MVKLASTRESRAYGPGRRTRNRWEYLNAGFYLLAALFLVCGLSVLLSPFPYSANYGLPLTLLGLAFLLPVNAHDLVAHLAGFDYCFPLFEFDLQLALVEFSVPVINIVGTILAFVGVLLLSLQTENGYNELLQKHALNTLIAGPLFWLIGSIHNICQIYERANGHVQILQKCVQLPLLTGSLLFLVAGILSKCHVFGSIHAQRIVERNWGWLGLCGSVLFMVGGLMNVIKVFKMQQMDGLRLEKLRGSAYERLSKGREDRLTLILGNGRMKKQFEEVGLLQEKTGARERSSEGSQQDLLNTHISFQGNNMKSIVLFF
ncbi:hypothetical protein ZIOFF_018139 [Zingiber officinale]|uniref:Uncharacterized protein n=1 Tax=Zingiber officinale TaxID=94328 RepID=A0A8J5HKI2_ZINOF|nr:hypothetical protein ZIOFF_018139 [Zingiber officinale]